MSTSTLASCEIIAPTAIMFEGDVHVDGLVLGMVLLLWLVIRMKQ